ncbi:MAG: N-methylhydantoinase A [Candidatus Bipolaricaulis sibiricus]|uniref:N-methylhydantoinase A n=1 Tax=Bipolaricaulis sibiricus TaxID=2501609 RepID=A0A410FUK1_BIPS1|nr:MAG: N-methylhydantoinase A [Candidatus Bipolaricaulis sibiricus]
MGIDIGGTFTDVVVLDAGGLLLHKFPTTPDDPARGVLAALAALVAQGEFDPGAVARIAHGSTVATNALLEGKLGKTALVTTEGFRDVLEIGRQNRPSLYDLLFTRPRPIVPRELRFEVPERIGADGAVVRPLDRAAVEGLLPALRQAGVEAVAVCFLFSFLNPAHEREAGEILTELGVPITLSSDLLPEFREYERASTTVINAALRPVVGSYLVALEEGSARLGLPARWQVMGSSGAIVAAATAEREPARILLSGPAGGVEGARKVGRRSGFPNLITLDMGGTSCDVALVRGGEVARTVGGAVGGYPVALPTTDIHTIGAGGGSLARLDPGGALRVGPESAGADPGPACYGRGGQEATVTDAHLVLGHLLPEFPLGGLDRLDLGAAQDAIRRTSEPLGMTVEEAALGILAVADAAMERAIRVISVERGHDPRGFALLAFGGAGPLHAVSLAQRLGIPTVLIPPTAGVLSALGLLLAEVGHETSQGIVRPLRSIPLGDLAGILGRLRRRAEEELVGQGAPREAVRFAAVAAVRYAGQAHELDVPLPPGEVGLKWIAALEGAFHDAHRARYGHAAPEEEVELVAVRVRASTSPPETNVRPALPPAPDLPPTCPAWFDRSGSVAARVVHRAELGPGTRIEGPAILLGPDATALLPPGCRGTVDGHGTLVVEVG